LAAAPELAVVVVLGPAPELAVVVVLGPAPELAVVVELRPALAVLAVVALAPVVEVEVAVASLEAVPPSAVRVMVLDSSVMVAPLPLAPAAPAPAVLRAEVPARVVALVRLLARPVGRAG